MKLRIFEKSTLWDISLYFVKISFLMFWCACVNSPDPKECLNQEIDSDSFWVYDSTCLKNADLGLDEDGVRKITNEDQYRVFTDCLPDNPEVDFTTNYVLVIITPPRTSFPSIQEIKLIETCVKQYEIQIEIRETMFQEANVSKYVFVTLPIEIPEPKIEIIWL